jgi:hypothetical protein
MSKDGHAHIDLIFDGPPTPTPPSLIGTEGPDGRSVTIGTWTKRSDGKWVLRITSADLAEVC